MEEWSRVVEGRERCIACKTKTSSEKIKFLDISLLGYMGRPDHAQRCEAKYLDVGMDQCVNKAFRSYILGSMSWKGPIPFFWNAPIPPWYGGPSILQTKDRPRGHSQIWLSTQSSQYQSRNPQIRIRSGSW